MTTETDLERSCEVVRFWTFVSDDKPFPFAEWPELRAGEDSR